MFQMTILGKFQPFYSNTKESMSTVTEFMAFEGMSLISFSETLLFHESVVEYMLDWTESPYHSLCIPYDLDIINCMKLLPSLSNTDPKSCSKEG